MITICHLLDDFQMGGVTRALTVFEQAKLTRNAQSQVVPIRPSAKLAPALNADLIVDHMSLSWGRLSFLASLRARNPKARIIHMEHSYTRSFEKVNVTAQRRFRLMLKVAASLVDTLVCVSHAQRDWFQKEVGIPAVKLKVIYPWSGRDELLAVPAQEARANRPLRLLAYGRYAKVKNFAGLITAMGAFDGSDIQLTLFGDGPERDALTLLASDLAHVTVSGPTDDLSGYLTQCDAVIVPSLHESFGLVATEARLAGRAIIVANVDGLPEQVGASGVIAPLETAQEIERTLRMVSDWDLPMMGAAGRCEVAGQHDAIIERWQAIIDDVSGCGKATASGDTALSGQAVA